MNESGRAVAEAQRFFKIPLDDVTVFYDELDLPPAKLRVKIGGGNAGHNGLRSITAHCGNDYRRVRLGIGHPGHKAAGAAATCSAISARAEEAWVEDLCRAIADNAALLAKGEDASFQNKVHLAMEARGWTDVKRPGEKAAVTVQATDAERTAGICEGVRPWASRWASSACRMSASPPSSTR